MASWPSTLPQYPLIDGFTDEPVDTVIRSQFAGYTKTRNRFTTAINNVEESYLLTKDQYLTFLNFFTNTLGNGSAEFTKVDPITNTIRFYRFTGPYQSSFLGVDWRITINLEKLP